MKRIRGLAVLLPFLGLAAALPAAELAKIERTIAKEPAYRGKPKYGLLVFGAEAKARAWLVLDGESLYVDRDGNGDLTAAGERVQSKETRSWGALGEWRIFRAGQVLADPQAPCDLYLEAREDGAVSITAAIAPVGGGGRVQVVGCYRRGKLVLADRAADAPIIHLNGPLTLDAGDLELAGANRELARLTVFVGTPGLGPETFAMLRPDAEKPTPAVELTFAPRQPAQPAPRVPVEFKTGCCGDAWFYGTARTPADAGTGKVKLALRFPDHPNGKVSPATIELAVGK